MRRPSRKKPAVAEATVTELFDVLIAGDMTCRGDQGFRVAMEIRHYARDGKRVALVQAVELGAGQRIAPEIQTCVRRGLATVADLAGPLATDLLVLHSPSTVSWRARAFGRIKSATTILVCHRREDFAGRSIKQRLRGSAHVLWAPVDRWVREAAPAQLPLTQRDWLPPIDPDAKPAVRTDHDGRRAIGWVLTAASIDPPSTTELDVVAIDLREDPAGGEAKWRHISLDRLGYLDGIAYFPVEGEANLADALVRSMLNQGVPVALPDWLKAQYGRGPLYCQPEEAVAKLDRAVKRRSTEVGESTGGPVRGKRRVAQSSGAGIAAPSTSPAERRPIMLLASNGVGVGHVSRLLAVARRIDPHQPVMFVTQAQAVGVIERFGYLAEYLPSAGYIGGSFEAWDDWFQFELETLIDAYDPTMVVYDGNNPSPGLIGAVASRSDCKFAWIRRGLWGNLTSPYIDNARWFDLIVEPGELDGQPDEGITAQRRHEARLVPSIRLLDEKELLPREAAAKALGLDPAKPSALIQLGAGYNRDIVSLIDHLVEVLKQVPNLQISIAEWVNGAHALNYWPDVKYLRGYPLSQYFKAFDFSISAAGYNTFHEVVSFGLPTIFIPNRHPSMDDQAGRAVYAQDLHAAFELDEADLADLPELVNLLMDAKARNFLADNCAELSRPNGAGEAAQSLMALAGGVQ